MPELLDAIKAELNLALAPGRYVLAGSTSYMTLPRAAQSLTGRVEVLTVWPFSQGELDGLRETFVQCLLDDPGQVIDRAPSTTSRMDYVRRVLRGGLPIPIREADNAARRRWYAGYLDLVVERDVLDIRRIRQRTAMPALLRQLVAQTGQLLNMARAAEAAGLERSVGEDYTRLLEAVFMVHRLPAWGTTLGARVNSMPKVHVVDTGLGGWLLGVRERRIERRDPTALQQFGHLLETFAVNELIKQVGWLPEPLLIGHYRTKDGHEVDLVLETYGEGVVGIEVKSGERVRREDIRGLRSLRDRLGDRFVAGLVLYPGPLTVPLGDRLYAVPIDRLWS
ncbi:MAG: ATP-binding protein [Pseudonocardia sp.]